jgi:hypothetical protein
MRLISRKPLGESRRSRLSGICWGSFATSESTKIGRVVPESKNCSEKVDLQPIINEEVVNQQGFFKDAWWRKGSP